MHSHTQTSDRGTHSLALWSVMVVVVCVSCLRLGKMPIWTLQDELCRQRIGGMGRGQTNRQTDRRRGMTQRHTRTEVFYLLLLILPAYHVNVVTQGNLNTCGTQTHPQTSHLDCLGVSGRVLQMSAVETQHRPLLQENGTR